ncbi:endonuclease/exonuclease/phosphatase family protein [Massilia genomosp. 1]|uniref:Endonuclease n=1 Tax=Massilia genomosp. 1 TaxID=2609280 RepID=A0ABX0MSB3_9BURK|nr:endonuclease/exonuclease/phosphatase family protein [Massilia genomosp. 1]NHZ63490.1 endonuclease [Massilia genomosp. 1]
MNLITWNIQRGRSPSGKCDIAHTAASLRKVADADVLCLQEVSSGYTDMPGCDGANQFALLAHHFPGYVAVVGLACDTAGEGDGPRRLFGNMILSRHPVLQVLRHALPWPPDPAVMSMQRIALEATLDTPLGLIRVTTTDLEYFSRPQRSAQVQRLRDLQREAVAHAATPRAGAPGGPFAAIARARAAILAGDCNFLPGSWEYHCLQAPFDDGTPAYADAWPLRHPGRAHAPTVCLHDHPGRPADPFTCDFIFVGADLAPRVAELRVACDDAGPDHQPLLMRLE